MALSFVLKFYPSETRILRETIRIDSLADFTFEALCQCARKLLPNEQVLRYTWKDEDGELISLETDDHLLEALRNMQSTHGGNGCLRIYPTVGVSSDVSVVAVCNTPSQSGACAAEESAATVEDNPMDVKSQIKMEPLSEQPYLESLADVVTRNGLGTDYLRITDVSSETGQEENHAAADADPIIRSTAEDASGQRILETAAPSNDGNSHSARRRRSEKYPVFGGARKRPKRKQQLVSSTASTLRTPTSAKRRRTVESSNNVEDQHSLAVEGSVDSCAAAPSSGGSSRRRTRCEVSPIPTDFDVGASSSISKRLRKRSPKTPTAESARLHSRVPSGKGHAAAAGSTLTAASSGSVNSSNKVDINVNDAVKHSVDTVPSSPTQQNKRKTKKQKVQLFKICREADARNGSNVQRQKDAVSPHDEKKRKHDGGPTAELQEKAEQPIASAKRKKMVDDEPTGAEPEVMVTKCRKPKVNDAKTSARQSAGSERETESPAYIPATSVVDEDDGNDKCTRRNAVKDTAVDEKGAEEQTDLSTAGCLSPAANSEPSSQILPATEPDDCEIIQPIVVAEHHVIASPEDADKDCAITDEVVLSSDAQRQTALLKSQATGNRVLHACATCNKEFKTSISLKEHTATHINDAGITCEEELPIPPGKVVYACRICCIAYSARDMFVAHTLRHNSLFNCCECSSIAFNSEAMTVHMGCHSQMAYGCSICLKGFRSEFSLHMHLKDVHGFALIWMCKTCGFSHNDVQSVIHHIQTTHADFFRSATFVDYQKATNQYLAVCAHRKLHYQPSPGEQYVQPSSLPAPHRSVVGDCAHRSFLVSNETLIVCGTCGTMIPAAKFMLENGELRSRGQLQLQMTDEYDGTMATCGPSGANAIPAAAPQPLMSIQTDPSVSYQFHQRHRFYPRTQYGGPPGPMPGGYQGPPLGFQGPPPGYQGGPPFGHQGPSLGFRGPPLGFQGPPLAFLGPPPGYQGGSPFGHQGGPPLGPPGFPSGRQGRPLHQGAPPPGYQGDSIAGHQGGLPPHCRRPPGTGIQQTPQGPPVGHQPQPLTQTSTCSGSATATPALPTSAIESDVGPKSLLLLKPRCSGGVPMALPSDFLFCTSNLTSRHDVAAVRRLAGRLKIRICCKFERGVTHLFMTSVRRPDVEPPQGPNNVREIDGRLARRTLKLFQSVANKAFILSTQYAHQCLRTNDILAEDKHDMLGDEGHGCCDGLRSARNDPKGVFDGWRIVFPTDTFEGLSQGEMTELLQRTGARVYQKAADIGALDERCVLLGSLADVGIDYNEIFRRTGLPPLDREWIFDSILAHKVQAMTKKFLLCDEKLLSAQRRSSEAKLQKRKQLNQK